MNFYVYGYFEPESEIPFYIGKGSKDRAWDHVKDSRLFYFNSHFYQKLRKLVREGLEPKIKIIEDGLTEEGSHKLERILIHHYGRLDLRTGCLCNHTDGGEGTSGFRHREDTKVLMSLIHRRYFSNSEIRQNHCKHFQRPVVSFNLVTGQLIKKYISRDSVKEDGHDPSHVSACVNGKRKSHHGLGWRYS